MQDLRTGGFTSDVQEDDIAHTPASNASNLDHYFLVRLARWFARKIGAVEEMLYASFTAVVFAVGGFGAVAAIASLIGGWRQLTVPERFGAAVWGIGWFLLDMPCMFRLILMAIRHRRHIALEIALRQRMAPPMLRSLITLWWTAHFLGGAWMAGLFHSFIHGPTGTQLLIFIPVIGLGICANGFLMLAICSATSSAPVRMRVWRVRLLVDVVVSIIGAIVVPILVPK